MAIPIYDASVPVFVHMLENLKSILQKGAQHAQARKIDDKVFVNARLAPDMLDLRLQVRIATDFARGTTARLSGGTPPDDAATDETFADLVARVDRALAELRSVSASALADGEARTVTRKIGAKEVSFRGVEYLLQFALPNFYFHLTTAYDILRHNGVELGKSDFIGHVGTPA